MIRFSATRTGRGGALLVGVLLTGLCASQALAQESQAKGPNPVPHEENPEYRFDFSLVGGGHFFTNEHVLGSTPGTPSDDPNSSPVNSGMFGGILGLHFNRWIGLEAETLAVPTNTRRLGLKEWVFSYRGSFVLNFTDSYLFQPFILAGHQRDDDQPGQGRNLHALFENSGLVEQGHGYVGGQARSGEAKTG